MSDRMRKKISLAYDVSVLGGADRSGVFRVTEEIFDRLMSSRDIDVKICASLGNHKKCAYYLLGKRFNIPEKKLLIKTLYLLLRIGIIRNGKTLLPVPVSDLGKIDAYVSPWYKIPDTIKSDKTIARFVFIYDLIPMILPELCASATPEYFRDFINSLGKSDILLSISENTKKDILNHMQLFEEKDIHVICLGADRNKFYPEDNKHEIERIKLKYGIPKGKYFLCLSTLEPRKNFLHVVKSFVGFLERYNISDANLVISGNKGWKIDELLSSVKNMEKHGDKIIFTGFVDDKDLAGLYSGASCFIYMSVYEGFGLPILEAMQCGTPVITSDNSSIPEVVGDAGIMIEHSDENTLMENMYNLYKCPSLVKEMSRKSLDRAKMFSWDEATERLIRILKDSIRS